MAQSFIKTLSKIFHFIWVTFWVCVIAVFAFLAVTKALLKVDLEITEYLERVMLPLLIAIFQYIPVFLLGLLFFKPQAWHIAVMLILAGAILFVPRKWKSLFYAALWLFPIIIVVWNTAIYPQEETQGQSFPIILFVILLTALVKKLPTRKMSKNKEQL